MFKFYKFIRKIKIPLEMFLEKRFKPDFSDEGFISSLSEISPILQNAKQEYSNGNVRNAQELIVEHFRSRLSPKFFLNANDVKRLVENITSHHPAWRYRTLQFARKMINEGVDVYTDKTAPLKSVNFWESLKKGVGRDILYQVAPHRFSFAPQLILAIHYGEPALKVFDRLISSWQDNAEKDSLAYLSDLTVISRIGSLSWAWLFLAASDSNDYPEKWYIEYKLLKIIHQDTVFLSKTENQSAPNNHLMIYEFSKFYIGVCFPEFSDVNDWANCKSDAWVAELKIQTYPDGGGFEPSLHYHQLICESAIAYILLCKKNSLTPDAWVEKQLELFLNFQISIAGQSCNSLRIGDSSDHQLFQLGADETNPLPSFREIYRALYQSDILPYTGKDHSIEKAFWLLAGQITPRPEPGKEKMENKIFSFSDSGYYILNDENPRTRLIFRTGPSVNNPVFAGHMHSDLLSVYMVVNGVSFIVNSGTYTYRSKISDWPSSTTAWRKYFMGPESKNTVYIVNEDPLGNITGDFRESAIKTRAKITISQLQSEINWVEAEMIDGEKYSHFRRGVIQLINNYWVVYDVKGPGSHNNSLNMGLQLAEHVEYEQSERSIVLNQDGEKLGIAWSPSLHLGEILVGSLSPLGGWVSYKYGELTAATQLKFRISNDGNLSAFVLTADQSSCPIISVQPTRFLSETTELSVKTREYTDYILFRGDGCPGLIKSDKYLWSAHSSMVVIRFDVQNNPLFLKALNVVNVSLPELGLTVTCKDSVPCLDLSLIERCDVRDGEILVEWVQ